MENIHINPIVQRVQDGTVYGGADLCASCRFALRRKASLTGFSETRCGALHTTPIVPAKLAQCSAYLEKGRLTLGEMSEVAWIIESKNGKHIGFLSPEELRKRDPNNWGTLPAPPARVGF